MKKTLCIFFCLTFFLTVPASAQDSKCIIQSGEILWKLAVKLQFGLSNIIPANLLISHPVLTYPGEKINISNMDQKEAAENEVIKLVNSERAKAGLPPLTTKEELSQAAYCKAQDMADKNYFSHISPTYGSLFEMLEKFGITYTTAGENIAMGQNTPAEAMNAWMNSSRHRANILNSSYTNIGVGLAANKNGQKYWAQIFIKSNP